MFLLKPYCIEWSTYICGVFARNKCFTLLAISLAFYVVIRHYQLTVLSRKAKMLKKFPCVSYLNIPLLNHTYMFAGNETRVTELFEEAVTRYGDGGKMVYMWHLGAPHLIIMEPKVAEKVLTSNVHTEKGVGYTFVFEYIKNGLVNSSGQKWRHDRKLFNPAFSRGFFGQFVDVFDRESKQLLQALESKFTSNPVPQNIYKCLLNASINMIFESAIGVNLNSLLKAGEAAKWLQTINDSSHLKIFKPYLYVLPFVYRLMGRQKAEQNAVDLLVRLSEMSIKQRQKAYINKEHVDGTQDRRGTNRRNLKPFLDILVDDERNIPKDEYNNHLLSIVGAASDSTATSISVTLFLLAVNPAHQEKCHAEIDAVLEHDMEIPLTTADLAKMKYVEMCWKEALRLFPPFPIIVRRTAEDETLEDGRVIPDGVDCLIDIYHIHRDPELYPNPEVFDPLRFLPEVAAKRPASHYIPFSMGMRNCIGLKYAQLESMVVLTRILSRFTVRTNQNGRDLRMVFGVPARPDKELLLTLVPRQRL